MLAQAVQRLAHTLRSSLATTGVIDDALSKGQYREDDLIRGLRPLIPERYAITKGVVTNASGEQSLPQDVILLDRMMVGELLVSTVGLHPVEAVPATIQVKSRADTSSMKKAVENIASMKRLLPEAPARYQVRAAEVTGGVAAFGTTLPPFGGLFFFGLQGDGETVADAYHDACDLLPPRERPNAAVILDTYALVWGELPEDGPPVWHLVGTTAPDLMVMGYQEEASLPLLIFYVILTEFLREYIPPPLSYRDYLKTANFTGTASKWVPEGEP